MAAHTTLAPRQPLRSTMWEGLPLEVWQVVAHVGDLQLTDVVRLSTVSRTLNTVCKALRSPRCAACQRRVQDCTHPRCTERHYWCTSLLKLMDDEELPTHINHAGARAWSSVMFRFDVARFMETEQAWLVHQSWVRPFNVSAEIHSLPHVYQERMIQQWGIRCAMLADEVISDVSALRTVYKLDLSYCKSIVDVSALGNAHTLNLRGCNNIVDVSALGNAHTLDLSECENIVDVSALGKVHTLKLSYCGNIVDVSALGNVHTLNLSECESIVDVSTLGGVHNLYISNCSGITDMSALANVPNLLI